MLLRSSIIFFFDVEIAFRAARSNASVFAIHWERLEIKTPLLAGVE